MRTIVYSKNREYYYIKELACPKCNWISVEKFTEQPCPVKEGWVSHAYQYDGVYFRSALPFAFWKIKSDDEEQVDFTHELVSDYVGCGHDSM